MIAIRNSNRERTIFTALACVVYLAVVALSFLPAADKSALHTRGRFHSLGHLLIFSVVAYVAGRTSRSTWIRIVLFLSTVVFGFGIEYVEHITYRAALEWPDVVMDSIGVIGGTLVAFYSAPYKMSRKIEQD